MAASSGRCNEGSIGLGWRLSLEHDPRPAIQLGGDRVEVSLGDLVEVGALGDVLGAVGCWCSHWH